MKISHLWAIEILDSRGNPTLRTFIELENHLIASASVPSGASTGKYEAVELRDDNDPKRYHGQGVSKAVNNVNTVLAKQLKGINIELLEEIDKKMIEIDGTENKSRLGANTILSISLAAVRALSLVKQQPLWKTINEYYFPNLKADFPRLMVNIINGGKHANWNFDIQEFMISPKTNQPSEAARIASEIFHHLKKILKENNYSTLVGDEGGFSPSFKTNREPFETIIKAVSAAGYKTTINVDLGIDVAASELYNNGSYQFKKEGRNLSTDQLIDFYLDLKDEYPIYFFEDPFSEDDWQGFRKFSQKLEEKNSSLTLVIGDDLYTTNPSRITKGIKEKTTNAVLIKPNQIGTLLETVQAIKIAKQAGWKIVVSHRSGETEDPFIADLAFGSAADFLKSGSMSRSERLCKYNRLIEIENKL